MPNSTRAKTLSRQRLVASRRLDYLVNTEKFEAICDSSTPCQIGMIENLVELGYVADLEIYLDKIVREEIESYTVAELRKKAAALSISGYWSLSKADLLLRILHAGTLASDVGTNVPEENDLTKTQGTSSEGRTK